MAFLLRGKRQKQDRFVTIFADSSGITATFHRLRWRTFHPPPQDCISPNKTTTQGPYRTAGTSSHQISRRAQCAPPTRSEQNPKLFSSYRCSGYFSLQMSPPQTAGCGNFNLWRASTLQPSSQPNSALIEDTGDRRYYFHGALISHTFPISSVKQKVII